MLRRFGYTAVIAGMLAGCSPGRDYQVPQETITAKVLHSASFGPDAPAGSVHEGIVEIDCSYPTKDTCLPNVSLRDGLCKMWIDIPFRGTMDERIAYATNYKPGDCIELSAPRTRKQNERGGYVFPQDSVKKVPCP